MSDRRRSARGGFPGGRSELPKACLLDKWTETMDSDFLVMMTAGDISGKIEIKEEDSLVDFPLIRII